MPTNERKKKELKRIAQCQNQTKLPFLTNKKRSRTEVSFIKFYFYSRFLILLLIIRDAEFLPSHLFFIKTTIYFRKSLLIQVVVSYSSH